MAPSAKRTRQASTTEDDAPPTPTPSSPSPPSTRSHQRRISTTPSLTPSTNSNTNTATATPTRPALTRSAVTQLPSPTPSSRSTLSRSNSLLSTRRNLGFTAPDAPSAGRGGMLTRTQSTPAIASASLSQLKNATAAPQGGRGKGDPKDDGGFGGMGRWGKGKENVPPKRDEEQESEGSSRKRLRVGRSSTGGARGRSGSVASVASVRSEATGRQPSLAPSSSSFSCRFPSPSPSTSATSQDPLDVMDMDLDSTPTKSKRTISRTQTLPTPPPSSPLVDDATKRIELVRMQSDASAPATLEHAEEDDDEEVFKAKNPYKHLKSFLRLSSTVRNTLPGLEGADKAVIGRQEEKDVLRAYLEQGGEEDVGMYVSGPPGTGKTATVTALGREVRANRGWRVVEVGCMGLKVVDVWRRLGEELGCGRTEGEVREWLSQQPQTLIILDEIDSLLPPPPTTAPPATSHLLTRLFSLPLDLPVKLVAISNTLDLTLRAGLSLPRALSPGVLPFRAYSSLELLSILESRITASLTTSPDPESAAKVDGKAIELLTKKVEAQNGDLRTCLACLSAAVTLAEGEWQKKQASAPGLAIPLIKVGLPHAIKAFTSHTSQLKASAGSAASTAMTTPVGRKVKSVPLQGKMVLVSMLIFLHRLRHGLPGCPAVSSAQTSPNATPTKSESLHAGNLYATYAYLLSHTTSPFPPSSEVDFRDLLANLEVLGLVSVQGAGAGLSVGMTRGGSGTRGKGAAAAGPKIELAVREEEVRRSLGLEEGGKAVKGLAEEEVGRVWEREEGRVRRVVEKRRVEKAVREDGADL